MQVCTCVCIITCNWLLCIRPDGNKKKGRGRLRGQFGEGRRSVDVVFMSIVCIFLVHFLAVVVKELLVHLEPWESVVGHEMYTA